MTDSNHSAKPFDAQRFPDSEITGKIIGCAMRVHSKLGNGFQEVIYQRALESELRISGLEVFREFEMPIYYNGERIGKRRVDFLVEKLIAVEIKAVGTIEKGHISQALNYLEAYNLKTGMLINFGASSLQFHRLTNKKFKG